MESIVYKPIGYVKSPYTNREDMPRFYTDSGDVTAKLELQPEYKDALLGVEPGMKLLMLFHFHQGSRHSLQVKKRGTGPITGVFVTRSPSRPNLIGASVIEVVRIEGTTIEFLGVDVLDGTPVIDLKLQKE